MQTQNTEEAESPDLVTVGQVHLGPTPPSCTEGTTYQTGPTPHQDSSITTTTTANLAGDLFGVYVIPTMC